MDTTSLSARFEDAVSICTNRDIPKFLGFLSESEAGYLGLLAKKQKVNVCFFGGYDGAQRVFAGFFPERLLEQDNQFLFPIASLTFSFRNCDCIAHKDVLGSLMALGIQRDTVGGILIENGRAVVFLSEKILNHVIGNISKIGNVGVNVSQGFTLPIPAISKMQEFAVTVASERLDAVVCAVANVSRNVACELIESGLVVLNSVTAEKITTRVISGSVISIRKHGKYRIDEIGGLTKKGRLIIKGKKYI